MKNSLRVSEYFYSVQGEGTTTGIPAYFIRLTGCNLLCGGFGTQKDGLLYNGATWRCDTIDVWKRGESLTFEELVGLLGGPEFVERVRGGAHVIFTGGEPLRQQEAIFEFLVYLHQKLNLVPFVEVETNGTVMPSQDLISVVEQWNVSPKLSNSGMNKELRLRPDILRTFSKLKDVGVIFKFVVNRREDWDEINNDFLLYIERSQVVLMPAAESIAELENVGPLVAEIAKEQIIRMCTRMHVVIWNQLTGV